MQRTRGLVASACPARLVLLGDVARAGVSIPPVGPSGRAQDLGSPSHPWDLPSGYGTWVLHPTRGTLRQGVGHGHSIPPMGPSGRAWDVGSPSHLWDLPAGHGTWALHTTCGSLQQGVRPALSISPMGPSGRVWDLGSPGLHPSRVLGHDLEENSLEQSKNLTKAHHNA